MATTREMETRIGAMARQIASELGPVDESQGVCWLDAIENQAVAIGDAIATKVAELRAAEKPAEEDECLCPACGQQGLFKGKRERELIGRRGVLTIREPEYYCPACRRAFFPDGPSAGR